jgi:hypothetical protein
MNEFLSRLLEDLQRAHSPDRRAELLARIAGMRARLGDFDGSRKAVEDLRAIYGDGRSGVVTVSIMLAEGMLHFYESFRPQALDRFSRAQLLSIGMKYDAGIALSSAWKSNYHFEFEEYEEMAAALRLAVRHADKENLDAISRIGITLFSAFSIAGNGDAAQHWFMRAREAAAKNGDRLTIEGLLYSRAAFLVTHARAENCIQAVDVDHLRMLRMEVSSAKNFQDLSKMASLPEHLRLWDARLRMLEGEYRSAEEVLREVRDGRRFASHNFSTAFVDLEIAYCQAYAGDVASAQETLSALPEQDFGNLDVDEQLVAAWIKQKLSELDTQFGDPVKARLLTESAVIAYRAMMDDLGGKLSEFAQ